MQTNGKQTKRAYFMALLRSVQLDYGPYRKPKFRFDSAAAVVVVDRLMSSN